MLVNLNKRLQLWRERDVISEEDAHRIREFEASLSNRSWVSFGIAAIGVTALITGIISIVASNWDSLSASTKLLGYFSLQVGAGLVFLRYEKKTGVLREMSLAFFALLFWAGIGLFAQIYNLSGSWWQAILFWVGLALPATLYSNSRVLCSLWCSSVIATSVAWCLESPDTISHVGKAGVPVATAVLLAALGIITHPRVMIRPPLKHACITTGMGAVLLIATSVTNFLWFDGSFSLTPSASNVPSLIIPWAAFGIAAIVSLTRSHTPSKIRITTAILFVTTAIYLSIPHLFPLRFLAPLWVLKVCGACGFIAIWGLAATASAMASMKRLFNIASSVIALRFIIIYFEVFGDLSTTGFGLILSGAVIIGIATAWNRGRQTINTKLRGSA